MGNTKEGAQKSKETLLRKYGPDYFKKISAKAKDRGGKNSPGSFDSIRGREAGKKGLASRWKKVDSINKKEANV